MLFANLLSLLAVPVAPGATTPAPDAPHANPGALGYSSTIGFPIVWNGSKYTLSAPPGALAGGTQGQVLTKNSSTDYDAAWITPSAGGSGLVAASAAPTQTVLMAADSAPAKGASGTYAPPTGCTAIRVTRGGAGGGGSGSGTNAGSGTAGTATTFGSLSTPGGAGATPTLGGTQTAPGTTDQVNYPGAGGEDGDMTLTGQAVPGGLGGAGQLCGSGQGRAGAAGVAGKLGSGGAGGGFNGAGQAGSGGAAGATSETLISSPASSYSWTIGAGGSAGAAGTGGFAGAAGGAGWIIIDEFYQLITTQAVLPSVTTSDNGATMTVVNGAWAKLQSPYQGPILASWSTPVS